MFLWYTLVYASGETLLWIYWRLIGRPYIALARAGQRILQYIGCTREAQDKTTILMYIPTPLGAFHLGYPGSRTRGKFEYSTFVSYIQCANHTFDDLYTMASFTEMADSEPRQLSRSLNVSTLASKFQQVNTTVHVMFFLHHIDHFLVLKL